MERRPGGAWKVPAGCDRLGDQVLEGVFAHE